MPRPTKPARLWLKPASAGGPATWIIKDGVKRISTGLPAGAILEAEQRLRDHVVAKHDPTAAGSPGEIQVSDVLNLYVDAAGASVSRPAALAGRLEALIDFFGAVTLADVNGPSCRSYAAQRGSPAAARREPEDLRAPINLHRKEGLCNAVVSVTLPARSKPRERWLSRSEVAKLIWSAWRYRQPQRGKVTPRKSRQHVARFILTALYTSSRSAAVLEASFEQLPGRGFVDLDSGLFHRLAADAIETDKRRPTIRVPIRLLGHMRRWHANGARHLIEFDHLPVASIKKAFAQVVDDAGLTGVSPHVLRHTAITWSMQAGADPWSVGGYAGVSPKLIESTYGHYHPDHLAAVGEVLAHAGRTVSGPIGGKEREQRRPEIEVVGELNQ
jgi:integrase